MNALPAIREAERQYRRFDWHRDRDGLIEEVHRLTDAGVSAATIAEMLGMNDRQVQRFRGIEVVEPQRYSFDTSGPRRHKMVLISDAVLDLAVRLRDQDPTIVYDALRSMDGQSLLEVTMTALAGIDINRPKSEVFGWVEAL